MDTNRTSDPNSQPQTNFVLLDKLPENCKIKIAYATPSRLKNNDMDIVKQSLYGSNHHGEVFTISVPEDTRLGYQVNYPCTLMVYQLDGQVNIHLENSDETLTLAPQHYCALQLPKGRLALNLPKGDHCFFYFNLMWPELADYIRPFPHLRVLADTLVAQTDQLVQFVACPIRKEINDLIDKVIENKKRGLKIDGALRMLWADFFECYNEDWGIYEKASSLSTEERISQVRAYIHSHYLQAEEVRLEKLQKQFGFSRTGLIRAYRTSYGKTIGEEIAPLRLDHAKGLLADQRLSLLEVSVQMGFEYPHKFGSYFKKNTGLTPSEFRAQLFP